MNTFTLIIYNIVPANDLVRGIINASNCKKYAFCKPYLIRTDFYSPNIRMVLQI